MNKYIVITSIFPPTEAVRLFSEKQHYKLIVIGDKKTPGNWHYDGVQFVDTERQAKLGYSLAETLPHNHYCRKMIGYLMAIENKADVIVDTDDDNLPKAEWGFPEFGGKYKSLNSDLGFVNIYQFFTELKIWPRGLPLNLISRDYRGEPLIAEQECRIGVWQGLADEDPDVDAIYRLVDNQPCYFRQRNPIVLRNGTISPFNSQNTMFRKELFVLLYLPTFVTFRFTDILRGLIAQPIMWSAGYQLGFVDATVIQKRNPHDYLKDFKSEVPMYVHSDKIINIVEGAISGSRSMSDNLYEAYKSLMNNGIVEAVEMASLAAWLRDIERLS